MSDDEKPPEKPDIDVGAEPHTANWLRILHQRRQQRPDAPSRNHASEQPPDLTPEDEAVLDKAWESITDDDIEESVRWLDEIDNEEAD